jgi:hypothetical protein
MQEYPIKRGCTKNLKENVAGKLREHFGTEPVEKGGHYQVRYGALKLLDVHIGADGKSIIVSTESDLSVTDEVILETNRRFRRYLDDVTGFSTKERVKKAKSVEE